MAVNKKAFTMRLEPQNYEKFMAISKKNKRSMAAELELLVEQFIGSYETQNGQIPLSADFQQNNAVVNNQFGNGSNFQVTHT